MSKNLAPMERVIIARDPKRPNIHEYIEALFEDFFELRGDRAFRDDPAMCCGIAFFRGTPVTVAGHVKGRDLKQNVECNFGMPNPEGYRKFLRVAKLSEKFKRPIITFIDTPGAYPGQGAEERGQGAAIAECLYTLSNIRVPVISVITGEGGSGGALAVGIGDRILMLENAVYSVLSPEGFASILWKDAKRTEEAAELMKLTASDLFNFGIADRIIGEPVGGAQKSSRIMFKSLAAAIRGELDSLTGMTTDELLIGRFEKFRKIGVHNA